LRTSSAAILSAEALFRSETGTLEIYILSRFGAAILVNIRLNPVTAELKQRTGKSKTASASNQCRSAIMKAFRSVA
jgi:hypothetical protein